MTFKKRYQLKLAVCVLLSLVGAATFILMLLFTGAEGSYGQGYLAGIGFGLALGGIVVSVRIAYVLRSEERLRRAEIKRNDERMTYIRRQAALITLIIVFIGAYAASLTLTILGHSDTGNMIMRVVLGVLAIYAATCFILQKAH